MIDALCFSRFFRVRAFRESSGILLLGVVLLAGCSDAPTPPDGPSAAGTSPQQAPSGQNPADAVSATKEQSDPPASPPAIPKISIGGSSATDNATHPAPKSENKDPAQHRRELLAAMMPVQVMLGQWRGTTQRDVGDFKALDEPSWVWDFQSNRDQPAMVMTSAGSPYYREVRLTYDTGEETFQMSLADPEGKTRQFEGSFSQRPEEFQGDDQRMHVKYKLQLTQTNAESNRDQWQVTFNQQENNRYLVELAKRRGSNFQRFDTIATQRQGTSFAKSDTEYGERECIISGGLGTMQVSYNGRSFWVCCTGCKAAFEEDPESWIAEFEQKKSDGGP